MIAAQNARGIACIVLSGLSFVCCDSFLKMMLINGIPPLETLVLRGISATFWCFILVFATGNASKLAMGLNKWVLVRTFCEVVAVTAFIIALSRVPIADVTAIYQIAPLVVLASAAFLWGERVGPLRWLLIGLGLAGALLVAQPGSAGASPYALLCFITAFSSAARDVFTRKVPDTVPGPINTISVVISVMLAALIMSLLFEDWAPATRQVMLYGLGSGFFVMLGHLFVFLAFKYASVRAVAPFYYSTTIFAVISGATIFKEIPNTLAFVGIGLILACGLGVLLLENREENAS